MTFDIAVLESPVLHCALTRTRPQAMRLRTIPLLAYTIRATISNPSRPPFDPDAMLAA
jgi:hypothetical protein